jgi:hypothetical protein
MYSNEECRCCGRFIYAFMGGIHTGCIARHWGKHARGANASRCREYGAAVRGACEVTRDNGSACGRAARNLVRIDHGADVEYVIACNACAHRLWNDSRGRSREVEGPAAYAIMHSGR